MTLSVHLCDCLWMKMSGSFWTWLLLLLLSIMLVVNGNNAMILRNGKYMYSRAELVKTGACMLADSVTKMKLPSECMKKNRRRGNGQE